MEKQIGQGHKSVTIIIVDNWKYKEIEVPERIRTYGATLEAATDFDRELSLSIQLESTGEWLTYKGQQVILRFDTGDAVFAS